MSSGKSPGAPRASRARRSRARSSTSRPARRRRTGPRRRTPRRARRSGTPAARSAAGRRPPRRSPAGLRRGSASISSRCAVAVRRTPAPPCPARTRSAASAASQASRRTLARGRPHGVVSRHGHARCHAHARTPARAARASPLIWRRRRRRASRPRSSRGAQRGLPLRRRCWPCSSAGRSSPAASSPGSRRPENHVGALMVVIGLVWFVSQLLRQLAGADAADRRDLARRPVAAPAGVPAGRVPAARLETTLDRVIVGALAFVDDPARGAVADVPELRLVRRVRACRRT